MTWVQDTAQGVVREPVKRKRGRSWWEKLGSFVTDALKPSSFCKMSSDCFLVKGASTCPTAETVVVALLGTFLPSLIQDGFLRAATVSAIFLSSVLKICLVLVIWSHNNTAKESQIISGRCQ